MKKDHLRPHCVEQNCETRANQENDDNPRCTKHSRLYYAPWLFKSMAGTMTNKHEILA